MKLDQTLLDRRKEIALLAMILYASPESVTISGCIKASLDVIDAADEAMELDPRDD